MKVAVIISGNFRTWDVARSSFIEHLNKFSPDIFVSTYNLRYGYHPWIQTKINDNQDEIIDKESIIKSFSDLNLIDLVYETVDEIPVIDVNTLAPRMRDIGSATIAQIRKINQAAAIVKDYELKNNFKYDVIVKTRFDLVYNPIDLNVDLDKSIIFDKGNVYPNDCIYISSRSNMLDIFQFMEKELLNPTDLWSHLQPPHGLLHAAMKNRKLIADSRPIMAAVIRKNNKVDYY